MKSINTMHSLRQALSNMPEGNLQGLKQTTLFRRECFSRLVIHLSVSALRCNISKTY